MNIRTDLGVVRVSDNCKRTLARVKRWYGAQSISMSVSSDRRYVEVRCEYLSGFYRMKILGQ